MRVLIIGQYAPYYEHRYGTWNGVIEREVHLARELNRLGHSVTLTGTTDGDHPKDFEVVSKEALRISDFDGVIIVPEFAYRWVEAHTHQFDTLRHHKNVLGWFDAWFEGDDLSYLKAIGCSTTIVHRIYAEQQPSVPRFYLPWATTTTEIQECPYPEKTKPRVVYGGYLTRREIRILNKIAQTDRFEVWFCGIWTEAPGGPDSFTDDERAELFDPRVRFMSDLRAYPDHYYRTRDRRHGQLVIDDTFAFYQHADVAVCFSRTPVRQNITTSKLYDYLGAGLPIVVEEGIVNTGDALNIGAAKVVTYNDPDACVRAIDDYCYLTFVDHAVVRQEALAYGTWADRARVLDSYLRAA